MSGISGLVLGAGRSRRMGTDKALLNSRGVPLWARQRDLLRALGANEVFLSARPEQAWAAAAEGFTAVLHDRFSDCGPIGGLCAGLERMTGSHLAVLAVDLPKLPSAWLSRLRDTCSAGIGCVGARGDLFEPLAAVYPAELKWLTWEQFARGDYSLQSLMKAAIAAGLMRMTPIAAEEEPWFENWNTPADRGG